MVQLCNYAVQDDIWWVENLAAMHGVDIRDKAASQRQALSSTEKAEAEQPVLRSYEQCEGMSPEEREVETRKQLRKFKEFFGDFMGKDGMEVG